MENAFLVIDFLITYIESAVAFSIMGLVFEPKEFKNRLMHPMVYALTFAIIIFLLNLIELFSTFTMVLGLAALPILVSLRYHANLFQALSISSFYLMCVLSMDFLAIAIIGTLKGDSTYGYYLIAELGFGRLFFICILKLILISVYLGIKHIAKLASGIRLSPKHYTGLLGIASVGYCMVYISSEDVFTNLNKIILVNWISMMLAIIVSVVLVYIYVKYKEMINEKKISEMHGKLLEDKYESINQLYLQRSTEFHDFKNHLNTLYELVSNDKKEKTLAYILDLTKSQEKVSKKEWTGNSIIDFILDTKYSECIKNNIDFKVDAGVTELSIIKDKDLCNIFGNLLDNAIEACQKIPDSEARYIVVTLKTVNNIFLIDIKNSIHKKPNEKGGKLITTKSNALIHGLGLESVQRAVDKYDGHMDYTITEKEFEIYVTLYF